MYVANGIQCDVSTDLCVFAFSCSGLLSSGLGCIYGVHRILLASKHGGVARGQGRRRLFCSAGGITPKGLGLRTKPQRVFVARPMPSGSSCCSIHITTHPVMHPDEYASVCKGIWMSQCPVCFGGGAGADILHHFPLYRPNCLAHINHQLTALACRICYTTYTPASTHQQHVLAVCLLPLAAPTLPCCISALYVSVCLCT